MIQKTSLAVLVVVALTSAGPVAAQSTGEIEAALQATMGEVNAGLASTGASYRLAVSEYITAGDPVGTTVFFKNIGNKMLGQDFVPGDLRRTFWSGPVGPGTGDDITWTSDTSAQGAATPLDLPSTQAAIARAMATWQDVACSDIPLTAISPLPGVNLGFVSLINGFGGSPPVADFSHAGFGGLPLPPGVLGVTFTFVFVSGIPPSPTDIDNDGKLDVAFREAYYRFAPWAIDGPFFDVETVALHEAGHGLSQAHFGTVFGTDSNFTIHFAPRAVMNAGYTGIQQQLSGSDLAGHCANWSSWPNQ